MSASTGSRAGTASWSPIRPSAITAWSRTDGLAVLEQLDQRLLGDRHGPLAQRTGGLGADIGDG